MKYKLRTIEVNGEQYIKVTDLENMAAAINPENADFKKFIDAVVEKVEEIEIKE